MHPGRRHHRMKCWVERERARLLVTLPLEPALPPRPCAGPLRLSSGHRHTLQVPVPPRQAMPVVGRPSGSLWSADCARAASPGSSRANRGPKTPSAPCVSKPSDVNATWIRWRSAGASRNAVSAASADFCAAASASAFCLASASAFSLASAAAFCWASASAFSLASAAAFCWASAAAFCCASAAAFC